MLTTVLAHPDAPPAPHDLATAWNPDPVLLLTVGAVLWLHHRGRRTATRTDLRRDRAFVGGLLVLLVGLASPLDAASSALASAHMVQHVLLLLVAAPLFAFSAPGSRLLRGVPTRLRRTPALVRTSGIGWRWSARPVVVLLLFVGTLWIWHAAAAYDATLGSDWVHRAEHASFLAVAVLFWRVVLSGRRGRAVPGGLAVLLLFGAAMGSVLLSLLLTFASEPWYAGYATTTQAWGLTPLEDQHLAGALMWIPAGAIYLLTGLVLFAGWLSQDTVDGERPERAPYSPRAR